MNKVSIREIEVDNKKVLMRVDYNVPFTSDGQVSDDTRIKATIPTIEYLLHKNASIILLSHLGRPKGRDEKYSLKPIKNHLECLLGKEVLFAEDLFSEDTKNIVKNLKPGDILLLENVRFYPGEEENDINLSQAIADLGDIYVNEAFSASHRAHASTYGVATIIPGYAGLQLEKEVEYLQKIRDNPEKPMVLLLGGAKVSDKLGILEKLLPLVEVVLVGGGMAFTFLKALGVRVGRSLVEEDKVSLAKEIYDRALENDVKFLLPVDVVVAPSISEDIPVEVVDIKKMKNEDMGLDIGPQTVSLFTTEILRAATLFWNGPMGVFELTPFWEGTKGVLEALKNSYGLKVAGGGDTLSAINKGNAASSFTYLSTGGGASLEFLEGKDLPGISVLQAKEE